VTVVNGLPVRSERGDHAESGAGRPADRAATTSGSGRPGTDAAAVAAPPSTACGTGDIIARGRYYLVDERGWLPTIAVRAHVKAPTASAARGLGTGKADEGVGLEVTRTIVPGLIALVDAGYTVIGKPADSYYQNNWWYDVGVARDFAGGALNLSLFFEEYRAIVPGLANARGLMTALMLKRATHWRVQVTGQFGLSEGAPDHGFTFGASRRF
jgi:hypothetical protein